MENGGNAGSGVDPKIISIVSYLFLIGWIVALVLNNPKQHLASFHIRQSLGIILLSIVLSFIPVIGWIVSLVIWIIGLMSAVNGEEKPVPVIGEQFQMWFKGL